MQKRLTGKLFLVFLLFIVLLTAGLIFVTLQTARNYNEDAESNLMTSVTLLDNLIQNKMDEASSLAEVFSANNLLVNGLLTANKAQISSYINPLYHRFNENTGLSIMEVGDETGTVIYRAHNPSRAGDNKISNSSVFSALEGNKVAGMDSGNSGLAVRAIYPILSNNKVIGTLQLGYSDVFFDTFKSTSSADIDVFSSASLLYASNEDDFDLIGSALADLGAQVEEDVQKAHGGEQFISKSKDEIHYYKPIYNPLETEVVGVFRITLDITANNSRIMTMFIFNGLILLALIVFILLLMVYFLRNIINPIKILASEINLVAQYDLSSKTLSSNQKLLKDQTEIGQISNATLQMEHNLIELISSIVADSEHVSSSSEELTATSEQATMSADEVAKTIEEIANGASVQAEQTTNGAKEIEALGALITSEKQMVEKLKVSSSIVDALKNEGFSVLKELQDKTENNSKASKEVAKIIVETSDSVKQIETASVMIQTIADQTNLLALNAAIEAARAGEAGRGFAVVADEIRKLAEQSNRFASEISDIIINLTRKTDIAVKSMDSSLAVSALQIESLSQTQSKFDGIAGAIEDVKEIIISLNQTSDMMLDKKSQIIEIIEHLAAISEENAASTEEVSASVEQQNASMNQIASASESLAKLAEDMQRNINRFKL